MTVTEGLEWIIGSFFPALFAKLDSFYIVEGVSIFGFTVAIMILIIVIGAIVLRV